jgi:glycerol-3-phosphate dehydrogenase
MKTTTEVLIIGGGITGCGVLFDLAQRGFKCLLVERGALANGTSGRFHGLLHSGARYAFLDPVTARECVQESALLRRVMPHALEDTGGMFVSTPWDPPEFGDSFYQACRAVNAPVEEISVAAALRREPLLNPAISRAFVTAEATIEAWAACRSLADASIEHGAQLMLYHAVTELLLDQGRVKGALARNVLSGEEVVIECDMLVNAAGAWSDRVAAMAGCPVTIYPTKGTMIAMNYRMVNTPIVRCRPTSDIYGLMPVDSVALMGSTSAAVADADRYAIEDWEIETLLEQGEMMIPGFTRFRPLRAYAGVRPLYKETGPDPEGPDQPLDSAGLRDLSRNYAVLDHAARDGVDNFVTITGGKWTTYRLMAEQTADLVCRKLGTWRACRTAGTSLEPHQEGRFFQLGQRMQKLEQGGLAEQVICECELVTRPQLEDYLAHNQRHIINDLRRDLRVGMGSCQGSFCSYRAAGIMNQAGGLSARETNKALVDFLQERWKGVTPVLWGQGLRQVGLNEGIYLGLLGLDKLPPTLSGANQARLGELETEGYFELAHEEDKPQGHGEHREK